MRECKENMPSHLALEKERGKELVLEQRVRVGHFMGTNRPATVTYRGSGRGGKLLGLGTRPNIVMHASNCLTIATRHVTDNGPCCIIEERGRVLQRGGEGTILRLDARQPRSLYGTYTSHV